MSDLHGDELDADRLGGLFQELSDGLANIDEHAQLFVVGGAAMALAYDGSRVTRDVDALFEPTGAVRQVAAELSGAHGLEPDWLNDAVKGFLPGDVHDTRVVFESENLLVLVPPPEYRLSMKMHAARDDRDLDDAAHMVADLQAGRAAPPDESAQRAAADAAAQERAEQVRRQQAGADAQRRQEQQRRGLSQ